MMTGVWKIGDEYVKFLSRVKEGDTTSWVYTNELGVPLVNNENRSRIYDSKSILNIFELEDVDVMKLTVILTEAGGNKYEFTREYS